MYVYVLTTKHDNIKYVLNFYFKSIKQRFYIAAVRGALTIRNMQVKLTSHTFIGV